ncbi:hypothetical protein HA402_009627 [Bradysia odoriphaga]|nr:hypothetical protein HA402_009627 [Bradysia odoriphaga]
MASGKRNARLNKSLFKLKQEKGVDVEEVEDDLSDEDDQQWTKDETVKLMASIKAQLKERDTYSYIRRIQLLNWDQVKIGEKSVNECKRRLQFLIKKIRHVRTLGEILSDVDLERVDVKKPKSAYALFCEEMKNGDLDLNGNNFFKEASERFKKLSPARKDFYEKESRRQSLIYKQQCPKGTRRKRTDLTPFMLFVKHNEKSETDKDKLKRQYNSLDDSEKLKWIQKAITAYEDGDFEKILSKDEYSLFKGEPKQPMNAFNFFIKKLSTEQKVDFKTAVQAYRSLSKEEKDVYIEMSRKAKIQYKHDLATYLFSLPPDEQTAYLNKLEAPKRTRVKKEKIVNSKNDDDVDDDIEDDEEIALQTSLEFEESTIPSNQIEVIATQDSPDFDDAAAADNTVEELDVFTIKTEFDPTANNDHPTSMSNTSLETSKTSTKSKTSDKAAKSKASKPAEHSEPDDSLSNKKNSLQNECDEQTPRKSTLSKSLSQVTDDESISSSVSEKKRDKTHKRKRREEENEDIVDFENKKIKQEVVEPTRVPSRPYYYYLQNIYTGKRKKAKKTYIKLDHAERKRIKKEHRRLHKEYLARLQEFCSTITSKKEMESFAERMRRAEEIEAETSDPDE